MKSHALAGISAVWRLALTAALALPVHGASAQSESTAPSDSPEAVIVDEMIECTSEESDSQRLACFDAVAERVRGFSKAVDEEAAQVFTGSGDWQSEPFVMQRPWRINWEGKTDLLTIELIGPSRLEQRNIVDYQIGEGAGRSDLLEPGEYQLAVRAFGEWRVAAVEE